MREQWIEVTKGKKKILLPVQGLCVVKEHDGPTLSHLPDNGDGDIFKVNESYEEIRLAIEKVGQEGVGSIICARVTDTTLDVPDLVGPAGVE